MYPYILLLGLLLHAPNETNPFPLVRHRSAQRLPFKKTRIAFRFALRLLSSKNYLALILEYHTQRHWCSRLNKDGADSKRHCGPCCHGLCAAICLRALRQRRAADDEQPEAVLHCAIWEPTRTFLRSWRSRYSIFSHVSINTRAEVACYQLESKIMRCPFSPLVYSGQQEKKNDRWLYFFFSLLILWTFKWVGYHYQCKLMM